MSLLRNISRLVLAAPLIVEGLDAIYKPEGHVVRARKLTVQLERVGVPPLLDADIKMLSRLTGTVTVVAGLGLATGRAPRLCAAVLALANIPITVANAPFWEAKDRGEKIAATSSVLRSLALGSGFILAALDTEGRPSLRWRARAWQEHRTQLKAVKSTRKATS